MSERRKCPAINKQCIYFGYILDDNNVVTYPMCGHAGNRNQTDRNCTKEFCPTLKKGKIKK